MDRRKFLKTSGVLCGLGVTGAVILIESCKKNSTNSTAAQGPTVNFTLDLSKTSYAALNNSGGSAASNGVVIANSGGNYIAVAQSCTHNGCSVNYNSGGNNFICPCHNGSFDSGGKVTAGPPPAPLKTYSVTKNGSILTVSG